VTTLLSVPNVSEGRDTGLIETIAQGFDARLLDIHRDPDHNRSVFTIAASPEELPGAVLEGARRTVGSIELGRHQGAHPRIGVLDVAPIVYLEQASAGAACAAALVLGDLLGDELQLPVFLYGALADGRTRAQLRRGGPAALAERLANGELRADFGPQQLHPTAGAVLVAARPPLVAFNVELAPPASVADARRIAARIREGGEEGLPSVRAIGVWLERRGVAQVSTNVEDHLQTSLASVVEAIARHALVAEAELVGLAPRAAFDGFPDDVLVRGRKTIEDALSEPGGRSD
jgi:glutamate formiminotransferase